MPDPQISWNRNKNLVCSLCSKQLKDYVLDSQLVVIIISRYSHNYVTFSYIRIVLNGHSTHTHANGLSIGTVNSVKDD